MILEHLKSEGVEDAGPLMRGKVEHEDGHGHSEAAFRMLEQFFVGSVKAAPGYVNNACSSYVKLAEMNASVVIEMFFS